MEPTPVQAEIQRLRAELAQMDIPRENRLALALLEEALTGLSLQAVRLGSALEVNQSVHDAAALSEEAYSALALDTPSPENWESRVQSAVEAYSLTELEMLPVQALADLHRARYRVLSLSLFEQEYQDSLLPIDIPSALVSFQLRHPDQCEDLVQALAYLR